ncbi:ataxin-10 isoform X3 [Lathamus discolor]|uniref:ataxin-10 isoform X3 n=1 Tax=Lathamus discolor TaxID=678569 RepID=UPI0032B81111
MAMAMAMAMAAAEPLPAVAAAPGARLESVRALAGLFREAQHREMAKESVFQDLLEILRSTSSEIEQAYKDSCELVDLDTSLLLIAECFRCLRNACVECARNQHVMRFLIVTDYFLKCPELVEALYAKLSNQERVTLLELMMVNVCEKNLHTNEEMNVFMRHADFLAGRFQEKYEAVLKLTSAEDADEEALVAIRLLDVLCEMTSNNGQLEYLQTLPGLLETVLDTLRLTHLAGKQTVNVFTATHAVTGQEEVLHPAVDFKSHLIRLIGNLCYKNKENQDKVYELDGIPLILDNCSIDDNNPFVNPWAVYAIRNLTEQNERNQELIAQMEEKGLADNSALESMGLEIEKRDDKLILRSVRKKPS